MDLVHAGLASVSREAHVAVLGAAEEHTEELVQMGKQEAGLILAIWRLRRIGEVSYYWLEVVSWAGLLIFNGTAPPPSRKFMETPELPPRSVELSWPLKYWRRFTSVPLYFCPRARIPGTAKEAVSRSYSHPSFRDNH